MKSEVVLAHNDCLLDRFLQLRYKERKPAIPDLQSRAAAQGHLPRTQQKGEGQNWMIFLSNTV